MRRALSIFFLFILMAVPAKSQSRGEWLEYGDAAFKKGDYASAAFFYKKIIESNNDELSFAYPYEVASYYKKLAPEKNDSAAAPTKDSTITAKKDSIITDKNKDKNLLETIRYPYVVHQIAEASRLNFDYDEAEKWYALSVATNSPQYNGDRFWYGDALMKNGKYSAAIPEFKGFLEKNKDEALTKRAKKNIAACNFSLDSTYVKIRTTVTLLDTVINTGTASFAANFFDKNSAIVFTAAPYPVTKDSKEIPVSNSDLFISQKAGNGWGKPESIASPVNSLVHEGAGSISEDKTIFFFTRWDGNECAIYRSKSLNNQWLQPLKLNENVNTAGYKSMHPAISPDGTRLYFSSNRPGGKGMMDLWYCNIDEFGNAGKPVNLGQKVNTEEDDVSPFYHANSQTLYFSSKGHKGYGGLDVFKAYGTDSLWSTPKNLRKPVNSSKDDSYYIIDEAQRFGFLSSDRQKCEQCPGGYCLRIYAVEKDPNVFKIRGKVISNADNLPIADALVTIKDVFEDMEPIFVTTDEKGNYTATLREDMQFYVKAQKVKYFGDAASTSTIGLSESKTFEQDFFLSPIPSGDIVIPGIEYDLNSANLRPESKKLLDSLADFFTLNDNLVIEISSHTDSRGSDVYNLKLSDDRAKSVVDYLVSKGIEKERLDPHGYGETKLLISDEEIAKIKSKDDKEANHQKNRRTAFRILSEDYKSNKKKSQP